MTIPFIGDITIPPDTWSYSDWLGNDTGTFAEIANAIGAALGVLSLTFNVQKKTSAGGLSITDKGLYFLRKTVPATTLVTLDQGIVGLVGVFADSTADQYPVSVTVASGGTIRGDSSLDLAFPWMGVLMVYVGSGEYGIVATV